MSPVTQPFPRADLADVFAGNAGYAALFQGSGLSGHAGKHLAIVTCMDSRIDPLAVVGMHPGDVKILRNAGARVTDDVLRTLVLAAYLLDVTRVLVMPHTDCKMGSATEDAIHATIFDEHGVDTRWIEFRTVQDQDAALEYDLTRIRTYPLLPDDLVVGGAIYDVHSGRLLPRELWPVPRGAPTDSRAGPRLAGVQLLDSASTYTSPPAGEGVHWVEHLRSPHLSVGTYSIPAGGTDDQEPHTEDEIYYVVSGAASFTAAGTTVAVRAGTTLFVPADEVHRFHDVTADLAVLVVFAPAEGALA